MNNDDIVQLMSDLQMFAKQVVVSNKNMSKHKKTMFLGNILNVQEHLLCADWAFGRSNSTFTDQQDEMLSEIFDDTAAL